MSDDEKDFGICEYCEDERGLCDRNFLVDGRRFSMKLDGTFEVDTVSHFGINILFECKTYASFASTYNFKFSLFY